MNINGLKRACLGVVVVALAACSDSTGNGNVTPDDALRSLSRGFSGPNALPFALSTGSLGGSAGELGRVNVTIDGASQSMFALGLRVTYPSGTCMETVFIIPDDPTPPGQCTPPPLGVVLVMWQTRSGALPPDRTILLAADVGTSEFDFASLPDAETFPAFGFYIGRDRFGLSTNGTLTSNVTASNVTCDAPPPPFAAASTCHVATFDEAGQVTFELVDIEGQLAGRTIELGIPRQNILGILQAVTVVQPITLSSQAAFRGF